MPPQPPPPIRPLLRSHLSDPTHLSPDDAFFARSVPPRPPHHRHQPSSSLSSNGQATPNQKTNGGGEGGLRKRRREKRQRMRPWKKLLWVRQSYPDNYTDEQTFLEHLEFNPRLEPYEFWPLVADFTVIVQHLSSVIIFVCCFVFIFQERISPITVVSVGSTGALLGWICWDFWIEHHSSTDSENQDGDERSHRRADSRASQLSDEYRLLRASSNLSQHSRRTSSASDSPNDTFYIGSYSSYLSPKNQRRLATAKSAVLIYCALLGLSPILKSLTKSTTSDSIWAMTFWLMCINVFFFDYSGGVDIKFPASLSTNAALMASTVLASRLPSTTHVFSLTLFSIEVFGLFPVFRRHLRYVSWGGHVVLTILLVMGAGGGVALCITGGGWKAALAGVVLGGLLTWLVMGGCSWWLISLQKYKNEIHGPWDPARPVIRRHWD